MSDSLLFITDCIGHVLALYFSLSIPRPPRPLFHFSPHHLASKCSSPSLPPLFLPCLPSLLSFSDSTPCSLHVYFWSPSSSPPTPASPPPGSHYPSPSLPAVVSTHIPSIRAPVPPPHVHVCARSPSCTCTRTHRCIFTPLILVSFPESVITTDQIELLPERKSRCLPEAVLLFLFASFVCRISRPFPEISPPAAIGETIRKIN